MSGPSSSLWRWTNIPATVLPCEAVLGVLLQLPLEVPPRQPHALRRDLHLELRRGGPPLPAELRELGGPVDLSISVQSARSCSSCVTNATARHARVNTLPPPPPHHVSATARARASAFLAVGRTKRRSSRAPCQCAVSYASGVRVAVRVKRQTLAAETAPPVRAGVLPAAVLEKEAVPLDLLLRKEGTVGRG